MPINRVVLNASPLICLSKSGLADLLPALFQEVFVPEAVFQEVIAGEKTGFKGESVTSQKWICRHRDTPIDPRVAAKYRFIGTLGIIVLAKRRGIIKSVRQSLKKLQDAGFWISDTLVEGICREAGE
jgi:predicted nucleic acid-binding protein